MATMKGTRKSTPTRVRSMRSEHCFKELVVPYAEERPWDEELYITRIATLSMMEDAVEAKNSLEITNCKLLEEIAERTRSEKIQQVLYTISNAVLTTKDVDELIGIFREQLGTLLDTTNFYLAFYDESTGMLTATNASDEKDTIDTWPAAKSLTGLVIQQNKSLLLTIDEIEALKQSGSINPIGSPAKVWLGVPLEVEGKVTGAFVIQDYKNENAFTAKDVDMLEFISNQISISIQRKKAVQDLTAALVKAEENDRLKTAFLNNISHEIRTPMNAIIGFSGFLNEPDLKPADRQEYTNIICNATNQLLSIIEDIINISTVEAGQEVLRNKETNLNLILRNLNKQFQVKAKNKNVQLNLTTPLPDELTHIVTDETKVIQIFTNLLNNAFKFTKQGHVSFGYELNEKFLEMYVEDSGIGIPENMHELIFDRFRQADSSIAREYGGTGLGLSISKAYVDLLGGKIWLTSTVRKGTTFCFSLPYNLVARKFETSKTIQHSEPGLSTGQKTILIAEDEKFNYMLLSELFKGLNAKIIWAHNGLEVLQVYKTQAHVDLVIMDMKMPVMNGFEATQLLREFSPDVPIIALTAYASEKEKIKVLECGCSEMITKPINIKQFRVLISKYLSGSKSLLSINTQPDKCAV